MRKKDWPIFVADFETTPEAQYLAEHETRVYLWEYKSLDGKIVEKGIDIESFFDSILAHTQGRSIIYFHNLSFDGEFILWRLMRRGFKAVEDEPSDNKTFVPIITDMGTIFKIVSQEANKVLEFRCSYRLFPQSIEKIGKLVGVKKLNETHDYDEFKNYKTIDEVKPEEWLYIENDVEILRLLVVYLKSIGMLAISIATASYKNWQKDRYFMSKQKFIPSKDPQVMNDIEKSYKGGITMSNPIYSGQVVDKAVSYDVNSLYPSVMYENSMPCGEGHVFPSLEKCYFPKKIVAVYIVHAQVINGYIPFIGSMGFSYSSYKYEKEMNDKWLYLWEEEFELFKMVYYGEWKVDHVTGFSEVKDVFNAYIDRWIFIKMNPSCPAERQQAKLCLNSLYGKFGENMDRMSKVPVGIETRKLKDGSTVSEIKYDSVENTGVYYDKKVASYITSRARCKLIQAIIANKERFLYCDTDSIYLKGWERGKDIPIDPKKLGYWKEEHHYTRFKALKAKCYIKEWIGEKGEKDDEGNSLEGKVMTDSSVAGLPRDARGNLNFDTLENGFTAVNCKKVKSKVTGGIIITTTDFKIHV